jgi:hypothetical protein
VEVSQVTNPKDSHKTAPNAKDSGYAAAYNTKEDAKDSGYTGLRTTLKNMQKIRDM